MIQDTTTKKKGNQTFFKVHETRKPNGALKSSSNVSIVEYDFNGQIYPKIYINYTIVGELSQTIKLDGLDKEFLAILKEAIETLE